MSIKNLIFAMCQKGTKADDGTIIYHAIANTPALDRDKEVVLPRGILYKNFIKNPVMLMIHDYRHVCVAKVLNLEVTDEAVEFNFTFADTEAGKELKYLYDNDFMSAFSIGFIIKSSVHIDMENPPDAIDVTYPDGKKEKIDLKRYKEMPRVIINEWELLEISPVPVPSNPEALLRKQVDNIKRKMVGDNDISKTLEQFITVDSEYDKIKDVLDGFYKTINEYEISNIVPIHSTPIIDKNWNVFDVRNNVVKYSSSNDTGDKESINWLEFSKAFAMFNKDKVKNFNSYKFLHHDVNKVENCDDELVVNWKGLTSAMGKLISIYNSDDTSLTDEEIKAVHEHLTKHYEDAGKSAPEFEQSYTKEEIDKIINEVFENIESKDDKSQISDDIVTNVSKDDNKDIIDNSLDKSFDELRTEIKIRFSVLEDTISELMNRPIDKDLEVNKDSESNDDILPKDMDLDFLNSFTGTTVN